MRVSYWLTCLWPGLPRLWWRGDWRALLTAISFAFVLNVWLAAVALWPEWLPPEGVAAGWCTLLGVWVAFVWSGWRSREQVRQSLSARGPEDLFIRAQQEYLQRHWFEAESLLGQLITEHHRDVDAHLMLATLYRHTQRGERAREALDQLERMEGAEKWAFEIAQERRRLAGAAESPEAGPASGSETSPETGNENDERERGSPCTSDLQTAPAR